MNDEQFLIKLREAFGLEAGEHLQAMTAGLLELERAPIASQHKELIETIFREAHSLKGAAGAVDRTDLQSLCQVLESIFSEWKRQPRPVAAETFDTLGRALDLVAKLLRQPGVAKGSAEQSEITEMVRQLGEVNRSSAPAAEDKQGSLPSADRAYESRAATANKSELVSAPPTFASGAAVAPFVVPHLAEPPAAETDGPQLSETVRIPVAKMDSLLRQAEEMIAMKLTARQHAIEVRELRGRVEAWQQEWAKVRDSTRAGLTDQSTASLAKVSAFLEWNQSYMHSFEKQLTQLVRTADHDERGIGTLVDDLLEDAKRLVMLPFGTLLDLFPKLLRDLARTQGKEATLILHGRDVEIDKRILQEMKDPLIHLVRNSIDHGLEEPKQRIHAGKPSCGTLTISITQLDASKVEIMIEDDGAGIDVAQVKASAIRNGTLFEDDARLLDEEAALAHIFDSGVSTSPIITEISGRGLGMAIVREKVEKLGGHITTESVQGQGTTFRIILPVTLATFKGILVGVGGQTFVIPMTNVELIKRVRRDDILTMENTESFTINSHAISFVRLDEVLGLPQRGQAEQGSHVEVVVLGTGEKRIGFAVDTVFNEQEVLVKNLGKPLLRVRNVSGATILGSGTPAIILNATDLLKSAVRMAADGRRTVSRADAKSEARMLNILVVDDSVTSRMLLKNILESSGFHVTTAIDGVDALTALKSRDFDLVVSDVEMPRMDGFDLTAKIRADKKLLELPVILVTALSSREHQERGIDVGANAYIVKSTFDQTNLLDVIRKLV